MPPKDVFDDAWCLWDTGAQSIMILTRMLSPEVRGGVEDGFASAFIKYVPSF
jgi:hypothetical protein